MRAVAVQSLLVALAWQVVPMFLMFLVVPLQGHWLLHRIIILVVIVPLLAGLVHQSIRIAVYAMFVPVIVGAVLFGLFALLVYVPSGQHP